MSSGRKRHRAIENNRAECPFTVATIAARSCEELDQASKKRKRGVPNKSRLYLVQVSPFEPIGKFKTCQSLDTLYTVKPYKRWSGMTRYRSFVLDNVKYHSDDFVYIANDKSVERQEAASEDPQHRRVLGLADCWVAKILEIRASDESHVYARVCWMYSPDELPANIVDHEKLVSELSPYYSHNELIASNHMDVINVLSSVESSSKHGNNYQSEASTMELCTTEEQVAALETTPQHA
ncbi:BAH domain-containing protein [Hirsutella rhossiliensis]|uniref:BAH domain-containing protein n=1 Tax=Hirsutella rhossiliensis TaxID=111463 RepID=A0A9P8MIW9_9HYPO|nr:BAH domain-containing protein [Hirsutella rhossiliensis]KAH0957193.1 BAH domain-containing protein [Hirsutella rhossiliensis]